MFFTNVILRESITADDFGMYDSLKGTKKTASQLE